MESNSLAGLQLLLWDSKQMEISDGTSPPCGPLTGTPPRLGSSLAKCVGALKPGSGDAGRLMVLDLEEGAIKDGCSQNQIHHIPPEEKPKSLEDSPRRVYRWIIWTFSEFDPKHKPPTEPTVKMQRNPKGSAGSSRNPKVKRSRTSLYGLFLHHTNTHTQTHTQPYMQHRQFHSHRYMHTHIYIWTYTHMYRHTHMCICAYVHVCVYTHV